MNQHDAVSPYPAQALSVAGPAAGFVGALEGILATLIPSDTAYWEVHCQVRREENGCTDVHVHTCTQRPEEKRPHADADQCGAYL
jgi:hypothetical protein